MGIVRARDDSCNNAEAYRWPVDISDDDVLGELLALNGGG